MTQLIDFSASLIEPEAIRAAGYSGVIGYFSESRPGANFGAKPLRRDYCDRLRAAGLEIVTNYQYGKGESSDWFGGYDGGCRHAEIALRNHFDAGGPGYRPLYAPVDANPSLAQWNEFIAPFLRGWASVVGPQWTGMYGNARCIDWALEDGVAQWFWQHNWSGDASINGHHPAAHLHQIEIDKRRVGGVGVDVNEVLKPDYGQWSLATIRGGGAVGTPLGADLVPYREQLSGLWDDVDNTKQLIVQHTTESEGGNTSVIGFLERTGNGSYQTMVDFDGEEVRMVADNRRAWAAMTQGNRRGLHTCVMGRAGWNRDRWLQEGKLLERTAMRYAEWHQAYGIPLVKISPADAANGVRGIVGHIDITEAFHESDHWDPGHEFPYDVVIARARELAGAQPNGDTDMTPEQERKLDRIYEELTKLFPSRSKYRADDEPVDTFAGMALNTDARVHEDHVEREALMGAPWAIDRVRREAAKGDEGASAVLAKIEAK
ncbi:glycoside hydrolase domain-containing protein [Nocardia wallacei]|uniref:glycoside hydrolase domain-containing protein n=1 Tax=Nocardia wallacei TaxID=480035 RepID=UPI0024578FC5|nr:glycoside hydrolase domain-containing protein [Nocardia wallacei]